MEPIFVTGIVFFFTYKIIELAARRKERRLMVEKMTEISPEMLQQNINSFNAFQNDGLKFNKFSMLRWGAAALGVGIGWILGFVLYFHQLEMLKHTEELWRFRGMLESVFAATIALSVGIALIIVYLIERKSVKKE
jgi:hypothetical protein